MKNLNHYIVDIGELLLQSDKLCLYEWDLFSIVYDIADGHTADSGFLYIGNEVIPVTSRNSNDKRSLPNKIREFRDAMAEQTDRKSTRLNSSHVRISYAVFCLKKKKKKKNKNNKTTINQ